MRPERLKNSNSILLTGLLMLAAGLPLSLFITSLSQFFILGSYFLEGSLRDKIKKSFSNRLALLISGIWLLHLAGMLWTSDLDEGFRDLRIKLPLLILPFVLAGSPALSQKQYKLILATFVGAVFAGSVVSIAVFYGLTGHEVLNIRDIFIFNISHIRFALFTCLSVFILFYFLRKSMAGGQKLISTIAVALILYFSAFLVFMESVTGIIILAITVIVHLFIAGFRSSSKAMRYFLIAVSVILPVILVIEVRTVIREYFVRHDYPVNLSEKTGSGNDYVSLTDVNLFENGYPIWVYVCEKELREEWNQRSQMPYDSLDKRGQELRFTLIRFLSSKGLRKDAEAVRSLTTEEVASVEKGIANVKYQNLSNLRIRLIQIVWEVDNYRKGVNPSGHSVTQRLEFWKAAFIIISKDPWKGTGTGDMPEAYKQTYEEMNSVLEGKYRLRAHNQFISLAAGLGIPIMLYFVFVLAYSLFKGKRYTDFLFLSTWMIACLSMLTEDTLETQAGVTFVVFFLCLFAFNGHNDKKNGIQGA